MARPLEGRRVALAEGRQLEELARMLEREGALPLRCPLVSILDAPDPGPVVAWLRDLAADRFSHVVFLTGEGVRRLLAAADGAGLRDAAVAALGRAWTLTRGPKPGQALKEVGLSPTRVAGVPTTEGVIAVLRGESLRGRTVGVQLYSESNPALTGYLVEAGAEVRAVTPYVYAPAADAEQVVLLIDELAAGRVDAVIFTSSPQVDRLEEVARERGLAEKLRQGLAATRVAAVGPVVADALRRHDVRVDVCPEQGFVMKNVVQQLRRQFGAN